MCVYIYIYIHIKLCLHYVCITSVRRGALCPFCRADIYSAYVTAEASS